MGVPIILTGFLLNEYLLKPRFHRGRAGFSACGTVAGSIGPALGEVGQYVDIALRNENGMLMHNV